jgi:ribosome-associated protein
MLESLIISPRLSIPGRELSFKSVRASGPGGQNVNKVASKVELRFDFEHSAVLDDETKARLRRSAAGRFDADGRLVVMSQVTRDRQRNLDDARAKLAALVQNACRRPKSRRPTVPSRGAKRKRVEQKRRQGLVKRQRALRDE